mmetsp:Transcript_15180/g.34649  ORF Transcript_15180/g.34649 Transcript_15180/m.34649 type:complete len:129 (-) Transcript_15180:609-995(-)
MRISLSRKSTITSRLPSKIQVRRLLFLSSLQWLQLVRLTNARCWDTVDIAWTLLMEDEFEALRNTIYKSDGEYKRFRQLVVNGVMATDIVDKELKALRNGRWAKAFKEKQLEESPTDAINRKATVRHQ